ncbi:MAG: hypothetical protein HY822_08405 [Acidobacteria bacterium]|nr:hypothetical protein [Acidobacteriota bacterium]
MRTAPQFATQCTTGVQNEPGQAPRVPIAGDQAGVRLALSVSVEVCERGARAPEDDVTVAILRARED